MKTLTDLPTSALVAIHNALAAKPVNKFVDRPTALKRTQAVMDAAGSVIVIADDLTYTLQSKEIAAESSVVAPTAQPDAPVTTTTEAPVPADKVAAPRKLRGFRFVFPVKKEIKNHRPGTNRAKLVEMLSAPGGATFDELVAATWGQDAAMTPEVQVKTTYEAARLLHFYLGYGMRMDETTKKITLVTTPAK